MSAGGTVVGAAAGRVDVEFAAPPRCKGCGGLCMWRRLPATQRASFDTSLPLAVGERVTVALPERYILLGSLLVYGLPLVALLVGAVVGTLMGGNDLGAAVGAVAGIAIALLASPLLRRRLERNTLQHIVLRPGVLDAHADAL